jgi:hypothetical protein
MRTNSRFVGRADETQDRTLEFFHALLHGEILEDAFLDLLQAVMICLEHVLGAFQILDYFALFLPRCLQQPIDVVAHHGGFRRHRRHELELVQL